jgi:hypothetical protein
MKATTTARPAPVLNAARHAERALRRRQRFSAVAKNEQARGREEAAFLPSVVVFVASPQFAIARMSVAPPSPLVVRLLSLVVVFAFFLFLFAFLLCRALFCILQSSSVAERASAPR